MPDNFDGARGEWDIYDPNNPACINADDQTRAKCIDILRTAKSFVVLAVPPDDNADYTHHSAAIVTGDDGEYLMKGMVDFTIRMWMADIDKSAEPLLWMMMVIQLKTNFDGAINRYVDKGDEL